MLQGKGADLPELMLCLLLVALGGLGWLLRPEPERSPMTLWAWGWLVPITAVLFDNQSTPPVVGTPLLTQLLGALLGGFLVAGALRYADRRVPGWLLPAWLGLGAARWLCIRAGQDGLAVAIAQLEPLGALLAAAIVFQAVRGRRLALDERLLVPAFVAVGLMEAMTSLWRPLVQADPGLLIWGWVTVFPATLAIQVSATSRRARRRREQMVHALDESEARFRALTENAFDLIAETDGEGRITYTNLQYADFVPDGEPLAGTTMSELVHPDDRERVRAWQEKLIASREGPTLRARWRRTDGGWRWLESAAKAFTGGDGSPRFVICSRDVTERIAAEDALRHAHGDLELRVRERTEQLAGTVARLEEQVAAREQVEAELRRSEERHRTVSEVSSDFSYAVRLDSAGRVTWEWVTPSFTRIMGSAPQAFAELRWLDLIHPEDRDMVRARLRELRDRRATEFEVRVTPHAGPMRWVHFRMRLLEGERDGEVRLIGAGRDVTARRQAEENSWRLEDHLRDSQRLESLGVLAGGMAHDFNNQLSVILGNAALALQGTEDEELRQRLERIRTAAQHSAGLTDQMLLYAGKTPPALKPVQLSRLVAEIWGLLEASLPGGCRLEGDLSPAVPPLEGDETQLRQVIVNLVSNAAEAMADGGGIVRVTTGTARASPDELADAFGQLEDLHGDCPFLEVADTGPGIDPEQRARVFEPFFTSKDSGRGLGLAVVLGIVIAHRGAIRVWSPPAGGTRFRVLFPARSGQLLADAGGDAQRERPAAGRLVLVIDDEQAVLELTREFLLLAGYHVLTAAGGREALELFREHSGEIDAVVLDVSMPGFDGEPTLRALRELCPRLPVVVASGYSQEQTAPRFPLELTQGFLKKPYEPEELAAAIEKACAASRT